MKGADLEFRTQLLLRAVAQFTVPLATMITTGTFTAVRVWPQAVPVVPVPPGAGPVAPGAGPEEQPASSRMSAGPPSAAAGISRALP